MRTCFLLFSCLRFGIFFCKYGLAIRKTGLLHQIMSSDSDEKDDDIRLSWCVSRSNQTKPSKNL